MINVPGTAIHVRFDSFTPQYPPLYDGATAKSTLNLASVNAGQSNTLLVGAGGVNQQFLADLSPPQKNANLSTTGAGNVDDYQDRHKKLLAKAVAGGAPWEAYANTDPCAFSYVCPAQVNTAAGYFEGVCFVDVFDATLCPGGNPKNFAMLYVAPPYGPHFATPALFLAAIEATAVNIVRAIAGYNAIAAAQNLPILEALRNTLYSSTRYNQNPPVPLADIGRAMFAGFASELANQPHCGLVELQFPVGDGSALQGDQFAALATELDPNNPVVPSAPNPVAHPVGGPPRRDPLPPKPMIVDGDPVVIDDPEEPDPDNDPVVDTELAPLDSNAVKVKLGPIATASAAVDAATKGLMSTLNNIPVGDAAHEVVVPKRTHEYGNIGHLVAVPAEALQYGAPPNFGWLPDAGYLPYNDPALLAARDVLNSADRVEEAADLARSTTTTKEAITARKVARAEANKAAASAQTVESEANKPNASQAVKDLAVEARKVADLTETLTQKIEAGVKRAEATRRNWRIAKGIGIGVTVLALTGLFTWIFAFGGARLIAGDGIKRFKAGALGLDTLDGDTDAGLDILTALEIPNDVAVVHLVDKQGQRLMDSSGQTTDTLTDANGTWTAQGSTISFKAADADKAKGKISVNYVLEVTPKEAADLPAGEPYTTDPQTFTVTYWPKAVDIAASATDRSQAVAFSNLPDGSALDSAPKSPWMLDATAKSAQYVPQAGDAAAVLAQVPYFVGFKDNAAKLVVLFPALPVPDPASTTRYSRTLPTVFTLPDPSPAVWKLIVGGAQKDSDSGWEVKGTALTYTPVNLAASVNSAAIQFALVYSAVQGGSGTATVKLLADGEAPQKLPAKTIKVIAPNRTDVTFAVAIPADVAGFALKAPSAGWTVDMAKKQVVFTPASGFANNLAPTAGFASVGFTATSHLDSTVEITFPMNMSISNAARSGATAFDIQALNPRVVSDFSLSVEDAMPSGDTSGGVWATQGKKVIYGTPRGQALQDPNQASVNKMYVMTFADGTQARATLTASFTQAFTAYDIVVRYSRLLTIDVLKYCYLPPSTVPGQLPQVTLNNGLKQANGFAVNDTNGLESVDFSRATVPTRDQVVNYTVTRGGLSATAKITVSVDPNVVTTIMPRTTDCLAAVSMGGGQTVAFDVLTKSSAFFAKDPDSVVLTGLQDVGQARGAQAALLEKGGKSLRVPNEGIWLVGDKGEIIFTADQGFTEPPTPVGFQFADVRGNLSDIGVMVIDPAVQDAAGLPEALKAMDETAFWNSFQTYVSGPNVQPPKDADTFVSYAAVLAGALQTVVKTGYDPLTLDDYRNASKAYLDNGSVWEDDSTSGLRGIVSICKDIVTGALPAKTDELVVRYWRLDLMSRVAAGALDDDPTVFDA